MNFKGNAFSTGSGNIADAVEKEGKIHFLQSGETAFMHRVFEPKKKAFFMEDAAASYADLCWFWGDKILELFGSRFGVAAND